MKKNREKWRKIGTFLGKIEKKREKMRRVLTAESTEGLATKTRRHGEKSTTNAHEYLLALAQVDTDFFATEHIRLRQGFGGTSRDHRGFFVSTAIYNCPESKALRLTCK